VTATVMCEPRGTFSLQTKWQAARGRWQLLGLNWKE
jgi:hypothetical protein